MLRTLILIIFSLLLFGCGESVPKSVSEQAFDKADNLIIGKSKGTHHGNNAEAEAMAKSFSELMEQMNSLMFTGGKENRVLSLTGEKFLTYCQANKDSVLFLVHVPQFKRYKGEVRDSLLEVAWTVAEKSVSSKYSEQGKVKIGVGLKGSIMYGGSAIGLKGEKPKYENSFSIEKDVFFSFFPEEEKVVETAIEGESDQKQEKQVIEKKS